MREATILSSLPVVKSELKPPHSWAVSISGDNVANTANVQGYALCLPTKRTGRSRTSPINACAVSRDCRSKAPATAPPLPQPFPCSPPHSCHHTEAYEKPPYAQQESQCVRRLKERIARKGGLGKIT